MPVNNTASSGSGDMLRNEWAAGAGATNPNVIDYADQANNAAALNNLPASTSSASNCVVAVGESGKIDPTFMPIAAASSNIVVSSTTSNSTVDVGSNVMLKTIYDQGTGSANTNRVDNSDFAQFSGNCYGLQIRTVPDAHVGYTWASNKSSGSRSCVATNDSGKIDGSFLDLRNLEANITLAHFRILSKTDLTGPLAMVGGVADEFESNTCRSSSGAYFTSSNGGYLSNYPAPTTIDSYSESNRSTFTSLQSTTVQAGQAFTAGASASAAVVQFYLAKTGSPTGNITVRLRAATGTMGTNANPGSNSVLASATMSASSLTTDYALYSFTLDSAVSLTSGSAYAVSIYHAGDASNYVMVGVDDSSPTHSGNAFVASSLEATSFTTYSSLDFCFYVKTASTAENMTLLTANSTSVAAPTQATALIMYDAAGQSVTLGTDITVQYIGDGGTTGTTLTFDSTSEAVGSFRLARATGTVSGTGTTPSMRIYVTSSKKIDIHAASLAWK